MISTILSYKAKKHSTTGLLMDRMMANSRPGGSVLHDDSNVYVYNASSAIVNYVQHLGAIGDHLCPSLPSNEPKLHGGISPAQVNSKTSILQELVAESTPDLHRYRILRPVEQADLEHVVWAANPKQSTTIRTVAPDHSTGAHKHGMKPFIWLTTVYRC